MCKVDMLRAWLSQRLGAAVEEIVAAVQATVAEYERELCRSKEEIERQRRLLDALFRSPLGAEPPPERQQQRQREDEAEPPCKEEEEVELGDGLLDSPDKLPHIKEEKEEEEAAAAHVGERSPAAAAERKGGAERKEGGAFGREDERADPPVAARRPDDSSSSGSSSSGSAEGRKRNKGAYAWTRRDKQVLAAFFQEYPMFYNSCLDEFKDPAVKRAAVKRFVKEQFEDEGRPAPSYKQVMCFLKNYRTRFVKLNGKMSRQADEPLTATEAWIWNNFAYLRPHIKKRRGRGTRQSSSKRQRDPRPPSATSDSEADDAAAPGPAPAEGEAPARAREPPSQVPRPRREGAPPPSAGADAALSGRETEVKRLARYLTALMMNLPQSPT